MEDEAISSVNKFEGKVVKRLFQYQRDDQKSEVGSASGDFRHPSMSGGKKVCAVRCGYMLGLYYSSSDCNVQVRGFLEAEF